MIDPKELRIGNLIHQLQGGKTYEHEWTLTSFHWLAAAGGEENYSPIPITPEWLERLGFENNDGDWSKEPMNVIMGDGRIVVDYWTRPDSWRILGTNINFKYVHQLQNLFYVICGEELTIK